jgi:predicted ABC-type sugar transport system permease subunit
VALARPPRALCGPFNGLLITQLRVVPFIVTPVPAAGARRGEGLIDERRIEAPMTWLNDLLRTA